MSIPRMRGVIPTMTLSKKSRNRIPRMRGGDPGIRNVIQKIVQYSPHARG